MPAIRSFAPFALLFFAAALLSGCGGAVLPSLPPKESGYRPIVLQLRDGSTLEGEAKYGSAFLGGSFVKFRERKGADKTKVQPESIKSLEVDGDTYYFFNNVRAFVRSGSLFGARQFTFKYVACRLVFEDEKLSLYEAAYTVRHQQGGATDPYGPPITPVYTWSDAQTFFMIKKGRDLIPIPEKPRTLRKKGPEIFRDCPDLVRRLRDKEDPLYELHHKERCVLVAKAYQECL